MLRAVCIGECMVELGPTGPGAYAQSFAGDAFNTAVYLKRELGAAGEVAFLTAVGDDPLSEAMLAAFRSEGVSDRLAFRRAGERPGLYMIELSPAGERSFHYWRSASAARGWLRELLARGGADVLAGCDLVYVSGVSLAILSPADRVAALDLFAGLRGRVGRIAFDPNVRLQLWDGAEAAAATVERLAGLADILLPSGQDGALLWGEAETPAQLARWRGLTDGEVALTLAEAGACVGWSGGEGQVAAPPTEVLDTSGGGDSFNGAYLAARLRGAEPPAAAAAGLRLASRIVSLRGALPPA